MILSRRYAPLALILLGAAAFYALGAAFLAHVAHADPVAAAPPAVSSLDWQAWVAIGLGALAGLRVVVDGLLGFFKMLAPRTKTTVDDTIRNDLQLAHDKLDSLSGLVGQLVPNAKPQQVAGTIGGAS